MECGHGELIHFENFLCQYYKRTLFFEYTKLLGSQKISLVQNSILQINITLKHRKLDGQLVAHDSCFRQFLDLGKRIWCNNTTNEEQQNLLWKM